MRLKAGPEWGGAASPSERLERSAAAALAPRAVAPVQRAREKCKGSYSAFAAQLGLKSLAHSPGSAGLSSGPMPMPPSTAEPAAAFP